MKKSFMNNIKHFVDSNVRQRIDRVANNNCDFFEDDLLLVERQFDELRIVCIEAEKRISALLQSTNLSATLVSTYTHNVQASLSNLTATTSPVPLTSHDHHIDNVQTNHSIRTLQSNTFQRNDTIPTCNNNQSQQVTATDGNDLREDLRKYKKLPIVSFLKFLAKSCSRLKTDSLLATTFSHCSQLQAQLTKLYLNYEQTIELQCLKPIHRMLETDIPNIIKLRKSFIKSHNDLDSIKSKFNGASQKQQQQQNSNNMTGTSYTISHSNSQQTNVNKLEQLKKELDDASSRFEQAKDTYATELYIFVSRETELVNLFMRFYHYQAEYQQQVGIAIQSSLPPLVEILENTPRKPIFGLSLDEHLRHTGRSKSLVIDLCVHLLYSYALNEEGLFRIPGSSIKIRKIKSAINAWFVTLASHNELDSEPTHSSLSATVLAVYNLFKDIVAQRVEHGLLIGEDASNHLNSISSPSARDDSSLTNQNSSFPASNSNTQLPVFDVHTIAGLLKLYLRELPEPLFTHALYSQWIDATIKTLKNEPCEISLEQVIAKLPKTNYENLRYLIRFLHALTSHSEQNKMTATNLAITMAPSLIWCNPSSNPEYMEQQDPNLQDDMQSLNMQISSVGMSASLHALVIENLITRAEHFFPGPIQFIIPGLDDVHNNSSTLVKQDRCHKTASPTGLSTASSSSFSSASNNSAVSSEEKTHSRKGGSMDGLLNDNTNHPAHSRPLSVNLSQAEPKSHKPPPVPPAPAARSHLKNASHNFSSIDRRSSNHKPPAPLPPGMEKRNQESTPKEVDSEAVQQTTESELTKDKATSSSGTASTSSGMKSTRPSVPPPNRPPKPTPLLMDKELIKNFHSSRINSTAIENKLQGCDSKSANSLTSSDNLRNEFEELNAAEVDDIDISSVSVSPVVSLRSISGNEDSSFDEDNQSLERSWTDCVIDNNDKNLPASNSFETSDESGTVTKTCRHKSAIEEQEDKQVEKNMTETSNIKPPSKPPRSTSPKITHSTPL